MILLEFIGILDKFLLFLNQVTIHAVRIKRKQNSIVSVRKGQVVF